MERIKFTQNDREKRKKWDVQFVVPVAVVVVVVVVVDVVFVVVVVVVVVVVDIDKRGSSEDC